MFRIDSAIVSRILMLRNSPRFLFRFRSAWSDGFLKVRTRFKGTGPLKTWVSGEETRPKPKQKKRKKERKKENGPILRATRLELATTNSRRGKTTTKCAEHFLSSISKRNQRFFTIQPNRPIIHRLSRCEDEKNLT